MSGSVNQLASTVKHRVSRKAPGSASKCKHEPAAAADINRGAQVGPPGPYRRLAVWASPRELHPSSHKARRKLTVSEHRPQGIFGVPLRQSITYANVAISLVDEDGKSYIYGYVPIVVAKCGVFLKERGAYTHPTRHPRGTSVNADTRRSDRDRGYLSS